MPTLGHLPVPRASTLNRRRLRQRRLVIDRRAKHVPADPVSLSVASFTPMTEASFSHEISYGLAQGKSKIFRPSPTNSAMPINRNASIRFENSRGHRRLTRRALRPSPAPAISCPPLRRPKPGCRRAARSNDQSSAETERISSCHLPHQ